MTKFHRAKMKSSNVRRSSPSKDWTPYDDNQPSALNDNNEENEKKEHESEKNQSMKDDSRYV